MAVKFTLQTLVVAVAAIAVGMGVLLNPTSRVASVVVNAVFIAVLGSACLAAGLRQPARSFCLGFAIACSGTLVIDQLGRQRLIPSDIYTNTLVTMMEEALPPIVHRGEPGTTRYYHSSGTFPIIYYTFGEDGTRETSGQMSLAQARRTTDVLDGVDSLDDLPHIDNLPTEYKRTQMLPYVLAASVGLAGGVLSYAVRRRGDRRTAM